jgi:uncharacterized protein (TIGR00725 family)
MKRKKMTITVFGTANPTKEGYGEAYRLGKLIAEAGHTLKNGGYSGTMEAAAKGCKENGGRVIGVCIAGHPIASEKKPNDFLTETILKKNVAERIKELLKTDMLIVLTGKIGTLEEFFVAWVDMYVTGKGKIFLVGEKNKRFLEYLANEGFADPKHLKFIEVLDGIEDLEF